MERVHVNKNVLEIAHSPTLMINQKVKALRKEGKRVSHFGFGQSPFPIHASIVEGLRKFADHNHYLPSLGLPELRQTISSFLAHHQKIHYSKDNVCIGPGSKELLYHMGLLLEGKFMIPSASWVSYVPQLKLVGKEAHILPTNISNDHKLTSEVLESFCKANIKNEQGILILNSPNNPTGAVYSPKELEDLAKVCDLYSLIVLADEIYAQINFERYCSPSIATYYPTKTIVFGGLSKAFSAGGYRMGYVAIPEALSDLLSPLQALCSETFSAVSTPVQYAAVEAYKMNKEVTDYIFNCNQIHGAIARYTHMRLKRMKVRSTLPKGAFYLLINFEDYKNQLQTLGISSGQALAEHLLTEYFIAVLPGENFYLPATALSCRIATVDYDGAIVYNSYCKQGSINESFIEKECPNIYFGLNQLEQFVSTLR